VKQLSVNIARIDDVLLRQQVFVLQGLMNGGGHGIIGDGSTGRFDMRDQVRVLLLARFGQMGFVAHPTRAALLAAMGVQIVGCKS